jgi:formylglycine-generating enzyme required for sulfatase activity
LTTPFNTLLLERFNNRPAGGILPLALIILLVVLPVPVASGPPEPPESMRFIPAGKFIFGKQQSNKIVCLDAFFLDQFEVSQGEFERVTKRNLSFFKGRDRPVENVNWFEARDYCQQIGKRLPSEWEWEKAAKAGSTAKYFWGESMDDDFAWYKGNSGKQTHPVGQKKPNGYGLYDMAGNVWEWTSSDHESRGKVVRGGSWRNSPLSLQSTKRIPSLPIHRFHYVGFRCAQSVSTPPQ